MIDPLGASLRYLPNNSISGVFGSGVDRNLSLVPIMVIADNLSPSTDYGMRYLHTASIGLSTQVYQWMTSLPTRDPAYLDDR